MQRGLTRYAVGAALIGALSFGAGFVTGGTSSSATFVSHLPLIGDGLDATPAEMDLANFWKAWNALSTNFVQTHSSSTTPTDEDRLWGAIEGLAAAYDDPYTVFFPPAEAKKFEESISGNFSGIGVEIDVKKGVVMVVAPLKGTPAEAAGVKAGDAIVGIDGHSTEGMTVDRAVGLIRGEFGTKVTLTLFRGDDTFDIVITRGTIQVPEIDDGFEGSVYRIALFEFSATSAGLFDEAFERFKRSGAQHLIIDVRGNPGGYLESAVNIASHFLPKGVVVVTEDYKNKNGAGDEEHRSYGSHDLPPGTKVVGLIDGGSGLCAGTLSRGLRDHGIATLIGTQSFGKGSVQELIAIADGSLKVTVARWVTPSGTSIAEGGLTPDLVVNRTEDDVNADRDPQMERAVEFLTAGA